MMWKEAYRLGVDALDEQHKRLFVNIEALIEEISIFNTGDNKNRCREIIQFLKAYAMEHFSDEEAYMEKIQYPQMEQHKALHLSFVTQILEYERFLENSDYALNDVIKLTGYLYSWLTYHVADIDQRLKLNQPSSYDESIKNAEAFINSLTRVINSFNGCKVITVEASQECSFTSAIHIDYHVDNIPDKRLVLVVLHDTAVGLVGSSLMMGSSRVNDLLISAIYEIANIVGENIGNKIIANSMVHRLGRPKFIYPKPGELQLRSTCINTNHGNLYILSNI